MHEIETKILAIDKVAITNKLHQLGAHQHPTVLIVEKAFDFADRKLGKKGKLLRLRSVGDKTELAYKAHVGKQGIFKVREEIETAVDNFNLAEKILHELGFRVVYHREKRRTSFTIGNVKFEIDEYPGIPPYLEIEASPNEITKYVKLLGFTMKQASNASATNVLKKYRKNFTNLRFNQ